MKYSKYKHQPVLVDDIYFATMAEAARAIGMSKVGIRYRCESKKYENFQFAAVLISNFKRCFCCKRIKYKYEFDKDVTRKDGINSKCRDCAKNMILLKNFNITLDFYNNMLKEQNNKCAICGKDVSELEKTLAVDHDHNTGKIRALLCSACNLGIGSLNDDSELLKKAIDYLEIYKTND